MKKGDKTKNINAVQLGRLGGKKGGPSRAKKLGALAREQIARKGGRARAKQVKAENKKKG